mmetsp:Transcript_62252/g.135973  ORF Transcript_62252/g.135973 Transcript_62252/m.135973 type:complete len:232 (-) Transcript_62252:1028-1723(-)
MLQECSSTFGTTMKRGKKHRVRSARAAELVDKHLCQMTLSIFLRWNLDDEHQPSLLGQFHLLLQHSDLGSLSACFVIHTSSTKLCGAPIAMPHGPVFNLGARRSCKPCLTLRVPPCFVDAVGCCTKLGKNFGSSQVLVVVPDFNRLRRGREVETTRAHCHTTWMLAEAGQPLKSRVVRFSCRHRRNTKSCMHHRANVGIQAHACFFLQDVFPSSVLTHTSLIVCIRKRRGT